MCGALISIRGPAVGSLDALALAGEFSHRESAAFAGTRGSWFERMARASDNTSSEVCQRSIRARGMVMVRADTAAVSWDARRKCWVIRLQVGEEVIKRPVPNVARDVNDEVLHSTAVKTATDEGL